jgi:2-polyprenyl-3-methyl-5-hydroxy-6-metoxy-1,4-benzoquinol methylase
VKNPKTCWCGSAELRDFSPEYRQCHVCGTLVSVEGIAPERLQVVNDETDFYGKEYWLKHQSDNLGFPDIHTRARSDPTERNLHWLSALLKYVLPPAKVLELGCAHGSFVALLGHAGFDASGVEMSPWVVEFGRKTFGVAILVGPVETLSLPAGSFGAIALMDVLEHLPDPVATMRHCLRLLRPDGVLLIQTPQFKEGMVYSELVESKSSFLEQLKADEHLNLFSERSIKMLFHRLGADYIHFEPAIFARYDMFAVVSRVQLEANTEVQIESTLLSNPRGRLILGLLDLRKRELELATRLEELEVDRSARGEQITTFAALLRESEADRAARGAQIEILTSTLHAAQTEGTDRHVQLETLTAMLHDSEADRTARGVQVESLTTTLRSADADRTARGEQVEALTAMLRESESDRAARGEQIESLTEMLRESEADRAARGEHLHALTAMLHESEADRNARGEQVESLTEMLHESEAGRIARGEQLESLTKMLHESEADRKTRDEKINLLLSRLQELASDRKAQEETLRLTAASLRDSEARRQEQEGVIVSLSTELQSLFGRPGFRRLSRLMKWTEVPKLAARAEKPIE